MHTLTARFALVAAVLLVFVAWPLSAEARRPVRVQEARSVACANLLLVDAEREPHPELVPQPTLDSCRQLLSWHNWSYNKYFKPVLENRCDRAVNKEEAFKQVIGVRSDYGYAVSPETLESYERVKEFCVQRESLTRHELLRAIISSPLRFEYGAVEKLEQLASALVEHGEAYLALSDSADEITKIARRQFDEELLEKAELQKIESEIVACMTPASKVMMEGLEAVEVKYQLDLAKECLEKRRTERVALDEEIERREAQYWNAGLIALFVVVLVGAGFGVRAYFQDDSDS